ncbi:MAG: hypothetical protein V1760_00595 [Candidatus Peregrinibacteria bacterium]
MQCKQCNTGFKITDSDRRFFKMFDVPEPALCPPCRMQRRMAWNNQINLYKRKCDATGEEIISIYHPDGPLKVYKQNYWWDTAQFDATEYGRDFDFSRPFFEQWIDLAKSVPRPALFTLFQFDENSEYTNDAGYNKNCYMIFDSDYNRDCYYSMSSNKSTNCVDNNRIKESELCFECVDCTQCYSLYYSQDCDNCTSSAFLKNCIGVRHSFMCSNLKNKEYHVFNKPYDKATYTKLMASLSKHSELAKYLKDWAAFKLQFPQRAMHGVQNENVTGDYLVYSKNAENCFDSMQLWDCKNFVRSFGSVKDSMDCYECGDGIERFYESAISGYNSQDLRFCLLCVNEEHNLDYSFYCNFSTDCFGCVGLNRKKFCILNKPYPEAEYKALAPKIIKHMRSTGEWGEFFSVPHSDFAYNETMAQEHFPMTKEAVLDRGWRWREKDKADFLPSNATVPDDSRTADESICQALFACEVCGRSYKIILQELNFYKTQGVVVPKRCFFCRHRARSFLRNPRVLFDRQCAQCRTAIKTSYAPGSPWTVYCEKCYQASLL